MKRTRFTLFVLAIAFEAPGSSAGQQPPWRQVYTEAMAQAREAFEASKTVRTAKEKLAEAGLVLAEAPETAVVRGDCGIVGCSYDVLVVQRQSTRGANTTTTGVVALVRIPAVGEPKLKLVDLESFDE